MFSKVVIASAIVASASGSSDTHWAYANYCNSLDVRGVAPNAWNQLGFAPCISSVAGDQTPIDIDCGIATQTAEYTNSFEVRTDAKVSNNGHSIKVSFPTSPGNVTTNIVSLTSGGNATVMDAYKSAQIHVHWQKTSDNEGSEHSIDGVFYPMEMHFVNYHSRYADLTAAVVAGMSDSLQVFGVMFQENATHGNAELQTLIDAMDAAFPSGNVKGDSANLTSSNPCNFIEGGCGDQAEFSFYNGGLTTPPCNSASGSIVQWAVNSKISKISTAQLDWFKTKTFAGSATGIGAELISEYGNSRPIQPRGQRDIYIKGTAVTSSPSCSKANIGAPWTVATNEDFPSCATNNVNTTTAAVNTTTAAVATTPSSAVNNVANIFVAVVASIFVALF